MAKRKLKTNVGEIEFSDPPPLLVRNLSDLAPRTGNIIIERQDGEQLSIPYRELSYKEWWEIGRMVDDPMPLKPGQGADDFAKDENGKLIKVYNVDWQAHQRAQSDAFNRRVYLRLAAFIDLPFAGKTLDEKADELINTIPNDILQALSAAMHRMVTGGEARIESRADTFHSNGNSRYADMPTDGMDDRAVSITP